MRQLLNSTKIKIKDAIEKDDCNVFISHLDQKAMDNILDMLWKNRKTISKYTIATNNSVTVLDDLRVIPAGGGLVVNELDEILFIFRKGHWDLPKGKKEKNEDIELAAIREVEEETGISNLEIVKHLSNTYHWYYQNHKWKLKESFWYYMKTHKQTLVPQIEEEIDEARWVPIAAIPSLYSKMYPNIKRVVNHFLKEVKPEFLPKK